MAQEQYKHRAHRAKYQQKYGAEGGANQLPEPGQPTSKVDLGQPPGSTTDASEKPEPKMSDKEMKKASESNKMEGKTDRKEDHGY